MLETLMQAVPVLLITTLIQFGKEVFNIPSKFARIASFTLAVIFGVLFIWNASLMQVIITILTYALSAIGLWEVSKDQYNKIRHKDVV